MLNWRALCRPATIARRALETQRRPLHVSLPRAQAPVQPRPSGVLARIRYRKDGKPRSRWAGAAFGTLILMNMVTLLTMYDLVDDSELALGLLASVIYTQKADMEYDKVNFDDFTETYRYFKKLYRTFTRLPDEEVDALFLNFDRLLKIKSDTDAEAQIHATMRSAAEQIHTAFQELNEDSISATANLILFVMKVALESMLEVVQDVEDDDDETRYAFQLIKDRSRKDPGAVLKDYEVLG